MEIKGISVKSTADFVKEKFPNRYDEWLSSLPESSKKYFTGLIMPSAWYPLTDSVVIPTQKTGELFFESPEQAAREVGRYTADVSLGGIYKIFVKVASPQYIIKRAANVFSSYYRPAKITAKNTSENSALISVYHFQEQDELIITRMAGWIQKGAEITRKRNVQTKTEKTEGENEAVYTISVSWD